MQVTTDEMVLFWKSDSIYSNWHQSRFYIDNDLFDNSEAAFMYYKALYFDDLDIAHQIKGSSQNPKDMKALGRQVKNFIDDNAWRSARFDIMHNVCLHKFSQNPNLKSALIATGTRLIVEASPVDSIWGIGLAPDNPLALNINTWRGQNLLGKVLMRVRQILTSDVPAQIKCLVI